MNNIKKNKGKRYNPIMYNGNILAQLKTSLIHREFLNMKVKFVTHEIAHLYKDSEMLIEITIKLKCIRKSQVFPKINDITNSK